MLLDCVLLDVCDCLPGSQNQSIVRHFEFSVAAIIIVALCKALTYLVVKIDAFNTGFVVCDLLGLVSYGLLC